ncbi:hypothetical protein KI387_013410, partial [Taxus chinensis]
SPFRPNRPVCVLRVHLFQLSWTVCDKFFRFTQFGRFASSRHKCPELLSAKVLLFGRSRWFASFASSCPRCPRV